MLQQPQVEAKPIQIPVNTTTNSYNTVKNEGGMFKKKNPYAIDETPKANEQAPKTFILSPKGASLTPSFKADPIVEVRAAEMIEPVGIKRGMKIGPSEPEGPRVFKKSDFAIGKKMGKGQFGEVMLVVHKATGFLCGMKVMSKKQIR